MEWIDTHTHLFAEQFRQDIDTVIENCRLQGINTLCLPNIDLSSVKDMEALSDRWPGTCLPIIGLHPCSVDGDYRKVLRELYQLLTERPDRYIAIGETGTDLYWDKTYEREMEIAFREQIRWAGELDKPVVIHSRDSLDWSIAIVRDLKKKFPDLRGVFHCFSGSPEQAESIAALDFYMGLGGVITFKNSGMEEVLQSIDLDRVVLETDSPYLAPVPYRGKRNSSEYLPLIGQKLADVRNLSLPEIARVSTENARKLFRI